MSNHDQPVAETSLIDDAGSLTIVDPPAEDTKLAEVEDKPNRFFVSQNKWAPMTDAVKWAYVRVVARTGVYDQSAIDVGTGMDTARRQRNDDVEFGEAVEMAMQVYRDSLHKEIHRRAVVGVNQPVFYMGKKCGNIRKYSDKLMEIHAKRHIKEYRDHQTTDVNITGGVMVIPAGPQSVEEWEAQNDAPLEVIDVQEVKEIPADRETERS